MGRPVPFRVIGLYYLLSTGLLQIDRFLSNSAGRRLSQSLIYGIRDPSLDPFRYELVLGNNKTDNEPTKQIRDSLRGRRRHSIDTNCLGWEMLIAANWSELRVTPLGSRRNQVYSYSFLYHQKSMSVMYFVLKHQRCLFIPFSIEWKPKIWFWSKAQFVLIPTPLIRYFHF